MELTLSTRNLSDYQTFLKVKRLPTYSIQGHTVSFPDEYAGRILGNRNPVADIDADLSDFLFDYQVGISQMALRKRKFCIFADCGLGKTLMFLEWAQHVSRELPKGQCVLIVSPLMVVGQTIDEAAKFYPRLAIDRIASSGLEAWLKDGGRIGITNYEALTKHVDRGRLGALILDESSMLKSHYGAWGLECLRLGAGLEYKLACTGTPAPNDRIEYANHAVFMDAFPSVNSFLATYFVNRGQTAERWELKKHALGPFYRALSHWCIFLTNPAVYGWKDNSEPLPPINVHIHHVDLTPEQQRLAFQRTGRLYADKIGGITHRSVLSQISKGIYKGVEVPTNKPGFIANLISDWPKESTITWCKYNHEQDLLHATLADSKSIDGSTAQERREAIIADFKSGKCKSLLSKPKILGFGLNLQRCTRMVFSGLEDSYESYYQAVKRANRYGAKKPLNVHIPITDIEAPMIESVLRKAKMVQQDTEEQERIFRDASQS